MEAKPAIFSQGGKRSRRWWIVLVLGLMWLSGCNGFFVDPTVASITVTDTTGVTTPSVAVGQTDQMQAIATFTDGTRGNITAAWSSSAPTVATINTSTGLLTAVSAGTTTVTAANSGITGTASVTVCGVQQAITIQPINPSFAQGIGSTQFHAFAGGVEVTTSVTWNSSNSAVATISNNPGSNGVATFVGPGSTTISASSCSFTAQTTLNVT